MTSIISSSNSILSLKKPSFTIPIWNKPNKTQFFNPKFVSNQSNLICNSYSSSFDFVNNNNYNYNNSNNNKNGNIKVDTCLVVPPLKNREPPRGIIKFLGGAFIGKVSHVTYSNGALLQVLTGSYFSDKIPKANAIVSFNNRPATEAVPYFEQLVPLVSQVMPMVDSNPVFSMANSFSGDAWKALVDGAGAVMSQNDPELLSSVTQFVDQLPSVLNEVRQGTSEFRPTPLENRERCKQSYNVPHTLLMKFNFDAIDETDVLEENLRPHVQAIGGTFEKIQLSGNHLTPCIQDPKWEVGNMYTPIDAVAQGLKAVSLNDTKVLAQTICNWLRRYEE